MNTHADQRSVELLVSDLPFNTNELAIKNLFAAFGEVREVLISKCASGHSRRHASVWMKLWPMEESPGWAGAQLNGRPLLIHLVEAGTIGLPSANSAPRRLRRQLY